MTQVEIKHAITPEELAFANRIWTEEWGGDTMVSKGKTYGFQDVQCLFAERGDERVGAATYVIDGHACELMTINATVERIGVGSLLLSGVERVAQDHGCTHIGLITSNDNLDAMRFYQRRGYRMTAIHVGAVDEARKTKSTIPDLGSYGIPIHDEIELVKWLA